MSAAFLDVIELGEVSRDWLSDFQGLFAPLLEGEESRLGDGPPPADGDPARDDDA